MMRKSGAAFGKDLVEDDVVLGRAGGAVERGVRLQENIPVTKLGDAAVDDGTVFRFPELSALPMVVG